MKDKIKKKKLNETKWKELKKIKNQSIKKERCEKIQKKNGKSNKQYLMESKKKDFERRWKSKR